MGRWSRFPAGPDAGGYDSRVPPNRSDNAPFVDRPSASARTLVISGAVVLVFSALMLIMVPTFGIDQALDDQAVAGQGEPGTFEVEEQRCRRLAGCIPYGTWTGEDGTTAYGWWRENADSDRPEVGDTRSGQLLWRDHDAVIYPTEFTSGSLTWETRQLSAAALGSVALVGGVGCLIAAWRARART